jgi:solute carrier family 25 carnitine/acylcarnitine transporter 20/29
MQNTQGKVEGDANLVNTAVSLYKEFGINIFFDGISPKLLRAAVNHSVTFFIYDLLLRKIAGGV